MKTCTPRELADAYDTLNPEEAERQKAHLRANNIGITDKEREEPFRNWLITYKSNPFVGLATKNWYGKVTSALFLALGIKQPKTKQAMFESLEDECRKEEESEKLRAITQ